ncbi:MAG: response regulator [Pyrinomonadaceae bacterium]
MIGTVLVVDDEVELKNVLVQVLTTQGYQTVGFTNAAEALVALRDQSFDVLLTDLMMPGMDGIELLQAGLQIDPHLICILMTGQGTIQTAVDAMRLGAFDYVLKPFRMQTILPVLTRAVNMRRLRLENLQLKETVAIYELSQTISCALDPQTVISKLADAALQQTDADEVSVLLPTSDGKELYVAAVRGENRQRLLGERVPLDETISSWVAREREALMLEGEIEDDRFRAFWPRPEITSAISVPMQVANKFVGTINLNAVNRPRPFTAGQMKALSILASTAGAAIETAALYSQLQRAEENYRSIFENAVEGIFQTTTEGTFLSANPAMARMLGYKSAQDLLNDANCVSRGFFFNTEARKNFQQQVKEFGQLRGFETQHRRKDGTLIWCSESVRVVTNNEGEILYYEGIAEDISERKRAESEKARLISELKGERRRLNNIIAGVPGIVFEAWGAPSSDHHHTDFVSDYVEAMLGYSVEEWLQTPAFWLSIIHPDDKERIELETSENFAQTKPGMFEFRWIAKDGSIVWVRTATIVVVDDSGRPEGIRGVITDITESKRLEEALRSSEAQLRQSQKLEAIGKLAGGIAHDFNNLLTVIGGYSSILLGRLAKGSPHRSPVEEIKKASDRASGLTRQLLAFSRKQILHPKLLDLSAVVVDLEKMMRRLIGEDIDLFALTDPNLGKIKADPGQIEQVLLNLIVNARDAMPQGGKLTIETANAALTADYARRYGATAGSYVMLAVSDTGCGMEKEITEQIFEPFFTTKAPGKGTGLGLSTVYGIVKQSDGHIWLYSEPGKGTTFKIFLPQWSESRETEQIDLEHDGVTQGNETILLVEDEDQVRDILTEILQNQGYRVLIASNGPEALNIASVKNNAIHLLLTDVVMPQMSGVELAGEIVLLRPNLKILYMSGYTDDAIVRHGLLDEKLSFLQKPFDAATVARKVRQVLDSRSK